METKKSVFETLSAINVNEHTEKKKDLTYLSWSWAWGITKSIYPDANYEVHLWDGKPYLHDEVLGYLIKTSVTIQGETIPMHLFVMDGANKAKKSVAYEYETKYGAKTVEAATMFDINTTIMRCLTKNLAMFGLGHYIYAGEDLPSIEVDIPKKTVENTTKMEPQPNNEAPKAAYTDIDACTSHEELVNVMLKYKMFATDKEFRSYCTEKDKTFTKK